MMVPQTSSGQTRLRRTRSYSVTRHEPPSAFDTELPEDARTLTFLNMSGHSTLTWTKKNDEMMRALIETKLKQGFAFWLLKPRVGGLLGERRVRLKNIDQAMDARKVSMDDEDFARIISEGGVQLVSTPDRPSNALDGARQSRDAAEIASSRSIGVRAYSGG
jgi:hypothetical protein